MHALESTSNLLCRKKSQAEGDAQDAADGNDISDDASTGTWLVSDDKEEGLHTYDDALADADADVEGRSSFLWQGFIPCLGASSVVLL